MRHSSSVTPPPARQITATLAMALLLPLILAVGALWQDAPQTGSGVTPGATFTLFAGLA